MNPGRFYEEVILSFFLCRQVRMQTRPVDVRICSVASEPAAGLENNPLSPLSLTFFIHLHFNREVGCSDSTMFP